MTDEKLKEFSLKISQSTKTGLVVVTDEIIIHYIELAQEAFERNDMDDFRFQLKKARQFVDELSSALDMRFGISYELQRLYSFVRKTLILAECKEQQDGLMECIRMMEKLKGAFECVAKSDNSPKVMEGSQKVYAGLTYGPGSNLNEYVF